MEVTEAYLEKKTLLRILFHYFSLYIISCCFIDLKKNFLNVLCFRSALQKSPTSSLFKHPTHLPLNHLIVFHFSSFAKPAHYLINTNFVACCKLPFSKLSLPNMFTRNFSLC